MQIWNVLELINSISTAHELYTAEFESFDYNYNYLYIQSYIRIILSTLFLSPIISLHTVIYYQVFILIVVLFFSRTIRNSDKSL